MTLGLTILQLQQALVSVIGPKPSLAQRNHQIPACSWTPATLLLCKHHRRWVEEEIEVWRTESSLPRRWGRTEEEADGWRWVHAKVCSIHLLSNGCQPFVLHASPSSFRQRSEAAKRPSAAPERDRVRNDRVLQEHCSKLREGQQPNNCGYKSVAAARLSSSIALMTVFIR